MRTFFVISAFLLLVSASFAQPSVSLTIYNKDLAAVRETRLIKFPDGVSEQKYTNVAARIDPTSVTFSAPGVDILEQNYDFDLLSPDKLLQKFVNQDIEVVTDKGDIVKGNLLTANGGSDDYRYARQILLRLPDGTIRTIGSQQVGGMHYPSLPAGIITQPTLRWRVNCESGGNKQVETTYLTHGMSWRADYSLAITDKSDDASLSAWVTIDNKCGTGFDNAKLKLIAGDIHQADGRSQAMAERAISYSAPTTEAPFEEHGLFEYHIYTLERPATVLDKETKQIELFKPAKAHATRIYEYNPQTRDDKIGVIMEFENSQANGLGMPLPAGLVRVYQKDKDGNPEFLGDDRIDHTPHNEKVRVRVGDAFDIAVHRVAKDRRNQRDGGVDTDWEVRLRNHKTGPVTIVVKDHFSGIWNIVQSSHSLEKTDAQTVETSVLCEPELEVVVTYTIHTRP